MTSRRPLLVSAGVGVLILGAGLVFGFGYFFLPGTDDLGAHPMNSKTAAWAMREREIVIPEGFRYQEGIDVREFVGADGFYARYLAPGDFAAGEQAVVQANPAFPGFRTVSCDADSAGRDFPGMAGFTCDVGTDLAVSVRPSRGAYPPAGGTNWRSMNTETLVLAVRGAHVELFAVSMGH